MASISIRLSPESKRFITQIQKNLSQEVFYDKLEKFFEKQGAIIAGSISRNFLSGQVLNRNTGNLARSIIGRGIRVGGVPAVQVGVLRGPALAYAGPQEEGTKGKNPDSPYPTIRPKTGKALAIPVSPRAKRSAGPRTFPDKLTFIPYPGGEQIIGGLYTERELKKGKFSLRDARVSFLLAKYVDLKPSYYLRDGFAAALPKLTEDLADFIEDLFREGTR